MRLRPLLLVLALAVPAVLLGAPSAAAATPLFRLADPRIDEASGIAAGITSPGVVYVENDSGDSARFFALDAGSGRVLGVYNVPGVTAVDWEDIAVAPDADGTPSVWLADIGDNDRRRSDIEIYRVDEPKVDLDAHDASATTGAPDVWKLTYPTGAMDAESLAVSPQGVPYVVTKALDGQSNVYSAPVTPDATTTRPLVWVGTIHLRFTGTPGPFAPIGELTATGADLSRDGTLLVIRTYTDAYLWRVTDDDVATALRTAPTRVALPEQPQGEGVCFDGSNLLIDSEGVGSAVYRVPVPDVPVVERSSAPSSGAGSTPPSSAAPSSAAPSSAASLRSTPAADGEATRTTNAGTYVLGGLAAIAVAGVCIAFALRRRRA